MIERMIESRRMTMINSLIEKIGQAETGERKYSISHLEKPSSIKCNFCNKENEYIDHGVDAFLRYQPPSRCDCRQAIDYWAIYDKELEVINKRCEQIKWEENRKIEIRNLLGSSNLGRRFKDRTFKTFITDNTNRAAYNKAIKFSETFEETKTTGRGIFFTGSVGTGKTHLAAAIANYLINEKMIPVKFGNISTLLSEVRDTYNSESEKTEADVIKVLSNVQLLIIDDLGKEKATEWTNNIIYTIINNRYENYKPTVVTTNLSIKELDSKLGDATTSRIIEMCEGIKMDGMDYRKSKLI